MNHVMIDLETFGVRTNSLIVSIGAVQFDPYGRNLGETFHEAIDLNNSVLHGRKIDPSTVLWWMQQSDSARTALQQKLHTAAPLGAVLLRFEDYLRDVGAGGSALVWGNGADFDLSLLQQAYEAVGKDKPWKYNASRCFRTLRSEFGIDQDYVKPEVAHDALSDAIAQAKTAQNIFARIRA